MKGSCSGTSPTQQMFQTQIHICSRTLLSVTVALVDSVRPSSQSSYCLVVIVFRGLYWLSVKVCVLLCSGKAEPSTAAPLRNGVAGLALTRRSAADGGTYASTAENAAGTPPCRAASLVTGKLPTGVILSRDSAHQHVTPSPLFQTETAGKSQRNTELFMAPPTFRLLSVEGEEPIGPPLSQSSGLVYSERI